MAIQQSEQELRSIARERGCSDALYKLGLLYSTGQGVPLDHVAAHKWFNLAAMAGNPIARKWRREIAEEMTPDQIAEAQRQAREWLSAS